METTLQGVFAHVRHKLPIDKMSLLEQLSMSLDVIAQYNGQVINDVR